MPESLAQVVFCEFSEISKNTFFIEQHQKLFHFMGVKSIFTTLFIIFSFCKDLIYKDIPIFVYLYKFHQHTTTITTPYNQARESILIET